MKKIIYTLLLLALGFFLMNNSGGRASSANQGNTGAPGDNSRVCSTCHGTGINVDLDLQVLDQDGQAVSEYVPGSTYRVRVRLLTNSSDARAYGFQMTSIIDNNLDDVETWNNPTNNAVIARAGDREYVEHNGPSTENTFEVDWTAPSAGLGSVTFYSAGNAVNGNGSTSGDGGASNSLTLSEGVASDNLEIENLEIIRISSNPVQDLLIYNAQRSDTYEVHIFDSNGRRVYQKDFFTRYISIDEVSSWNRGIYFVQISAEDGVFTDKFVI
jgi:hypothetical protein